MNIESLKIAVAAVITLALIVERGIELIRPLFLYVKDADWQKVVKIAAAMLVGFGVAALLKIDLLALLGLALTPVAGYAAAGVLASAGASPWHALLEWLKTIKQEEI